MAYGNNGVQTAQMMAPFYTGNDMTQGSQNYNPNMAQNAPQDMRQQFANYNTMNNMQYRGNAFQPQNVPPMVPIRGRYISSENEINILHEVPNDNVPAFFIMNDGSCIVSKRWGNDMKVITEYYYPANVATSDSSDPFNDLEAKLNQKFESLETMIRKCMKPQYPNKKFSKPATKEDTNVQ